MKRRKFITLLGGAAARRGGRSRRAMSSTRCRGLSRRDDASYAIKKRPTLAEGVTSCS